MPDGTFHFRVGRDGMLTLARRLPALLSGRMDEPTGTLRRSLRVVGEEALAILREAYEDKSAGRTDASGLSWDRLKPATVAYGKRPGAGKQGPRPGLTADQDRLWRQVFASALSRHRRARTAGAEGNAAAEAWAVVKSAGGRTVLQQHGGDRPPVGKKSGRLLASLGPAVTADTVLEADPGEIVVGTRVPYAEHFARTRPLAPDGPWPAAWVERLGGALAEAVGTFLHDHLRLRGG